VFSTYYRQNVGIRQHVIFYQECFGEGSEAAAGVVASTAAATATTTARWGACGCLYSSRLLSGQSSTSF